MSATNVELAKAKSRRIAMRRHRLKHLVREINPTSFLHYRDFLHTLYKKMCRYTVNYDFDQFTVDLGFTKKLTAAQVVLNNTALDKDTVKKIIELADFTDNHKEYFLRLVEFNNIDDSAKTIRLFTEMMQLKKSISGTPLSQDQKSFFSHWIIPVVYEMSFLKGFKLSSEWISSHIIPAHTKKDVNQAIKILISLGLLNYDTKTGKCVPVEKNMSTENEVSSGELMEYHRKLMELAKSALKDVAQEEREISSLTLKISQDSAMKIKTLIQEFEQILLSHEDLPRDAKQVYEFNVQFFPVCKKIS